MRRDKRDLKVSTTPVFHLNSSSFSLQLDHFPFLLLLLQPCLFFLLLFELQGLLVQVSLDFEVSLMLLLTRIPLLFTSGQNWCAHYQASEEGGEGRQSTKKKVRFQQTHNQVLHQSLRVTYWISVVPEATHASRSRAREACRVSSKSPLSV